MPRALFFTLNLQTHSNAQGTSFYVQGIPFYAQGISFHAQGASFYALDNGSYARHQFLCSGH